MDDAHGLLVSSPVSALQNGIVRKGIVADGASADAEEMTLYMWKVNWRMQAASERPEAPNNLSSTAPIVVLYAT